MKKLPPEPWGQFVVSCYELAWALDDLAMVSSEGACLPDRPHSNRSWRRTR